MSSSTDFLLNVTTRVSGNAASELSRLEGQIKSGIARYREFERAGASAASGLESVAGKLASVRERMAAALNEGNEKRFWSLAAAANKLSERQDALRKKAASAASGLEKQKGSLLGLREKFDALNGAQKEHAEGGVEVGKGLKKLGGPLGKIGDFVDDASEGFARLSNELGTAGAAAVTGLAAFAAVVVVVSAVTAAAIVGAAAFAKWAIGIADAKRSSDLTTAAMSRSSAEFYRTSDGIDEAARATGLASDRLQAITADLQAANIRASEIPAALRAIATQEAAVGNSSGTAALVERLKSGQTSAAALAKEIDGRLGGVVEKRMQSLDGLAAQVKRSLGDIFGGIPIEPFLQGLQRIVSLLDTQTESGRALKAIVEGIFGPLADSGPIFVQVERFILGIEIAVLKLAILVKGLSKRFGEIDLGPLSGIVDASDLAVVALVALVVVVGGLAAIMGLVAIAGALMFLPMLAAIAVVMAPLLLVGLAIYGIYSAASALSDLDWGSIGKSIVDGLLGPIRDPAATLEAFESFGATAVAALKDKLGIASPSRVFEELGGYSAEGFAVGIDAGAPRVGTALAAMTSAPASSARGEGRSLSLTTGPISITGVEDADDVVDQLFDRLVDHLDGLALQGGT